MSRSAAVLAPSMKPIQPLAMSKLAKATAVRTELATGQPALRDHGGEWAAFGTVGDHIILDAAHVEPQPLSANFPFHKPG